MIDLTKKSNGKRPKMSRLEKALANAARAYNRMVEANAKSESDYFDEKVQFATTDGRMGRPTVKLDRSKGHRNPFHAEMLVTREEAEKDWKDCLKEYRNIESEFGVDPVSEADITTLKKHTKVGRPGADKIDKLKKYIRRETRRITELQDKINAGNPEPEHGRGRKPIPLKDKRQTYIERVKKAQDEVNELITALPESGQIKHRLHDLRIKSRQLTVFIDTPEHKQNKNLELDPYNQNDHQLAINEKAKLQDTIAKLDEDRLTALKNEAQQEFQRGFDKKSTEIEERNAASKANFDKLRKEKADKEADLKMQNDLLQSAHAQMLEDQNKKLAEAIRAMGGDVDAILNASKNKTG